MTELQFLESHIFNDLSNTNKKATEANEYKFSEADFAIVLERAAHYGLGIYDVTTWLKRTSFGTSNHTDHSKKTTDSRWYLKAYKTFNHRQEGLTYAATYKVPAKLLARFTTSTQEEE